MLACVCTGNAGGSKGTHRVGGAMSRPRCLLQPALGVQNALRLGVCGQFCLCCGCLAPVSAALLCIPLHEPTGELAEKLCMTAK